ncbi:MAG: hypothetical protein R3A52_16250 [Polyangiales bacterium]
MTSPSRSLRWLPLALVAALAPTTASAVPYRLTPADRAAITTLMRRFFTAVTTGARAPTGVFPTRAELITLYSGPRAQPGEAEALAQRQLAAIDRDVQSLREPFARGRFTGLAGREVTSGTLDIRPCGRLALATSQCATGPVLEWTVDGQPHRVRIDTIVRLRTGWRIYDVRR